METVEVVGRKLELDADGNLKNLNDWDKEVAKEFAKLEGIEELTDRHWIVINFARQEFETNGEALLCDVSPKLQM
jgi:tRNA 2-thiouridine synthesizing protein E